jgi:hypothetical protein
VEVEAFATGWSRVQRSPTECLNKITKPRVWGGQGPYKDCRATDDDYDDARVRANGNVVKWAMYKYITQMYTKETSQKSDIWISSHYVNSLIISGQK